MTFENKFTYETPAQSLIMATQRKRVIKCTRLKREIEEKEETRSYNRSRRRKDGGDDDDDDDDDDDNDNDDDDDDDKKVEYKK